MSSFLGAAVGGLGGGAIGSALVTLALDSSRYNAQLAAAEGKTAEATAGMSKSTVGASGAMAGAYAAAGIAAVGFAASAIQSASEHEQVLAALQQQVGSNTAAFEEQATALQNLTGFQDEEILSADTMLSRFKLTDAQVRAVIPTILDYARATGKDVPTSAGLIGRALLGNARALKAIGINFTATGNTAADFATVMDLVNQKVGGQAAAFAETYAGKMEILAAKFDDLKEAVGGPLIDELTQVAGGLSDVMDIVQEGIDILPGASQSWTQYEGALNPLKPVADTVFGALHQLHDIVVDEAPATYELTDATAALADAMDGVGQATNVATAFSKAHSQAIRDEHAAEQELTGGLTGLIADMNSLNTAQQEVNTLRRQGKTDTQEYRTATLNVIEAQRTFNGDLAEQAQKMRENDVPVATIVKRLEQLGQRADLSRHDVRNLLTETNGLSGALATLKSRIDSVNSTPLSVTIAPGTISGINSVEQAIREAASAIRD